MSDAETATTIDAPVVEKPATGDLTAEVEKWKELARKNEQRAKDNAQAAKRLAEIEDANKSAELRAVEAEQRASEAEMRALRLEVASERGLNPAQAKRLLGSTREELEADADELLASFKAEEEPAKAPPKAKPTEKLVPGSALDNVALGSDPLEQILRDSLGID